MIELVLVYCLLTEPGTCEERRQAMTSYDTVTACLSEAEIVARAYLANHPKWRLARWRCEIDRPRQEPA